MEKFKIKAYSISTYEDEIEAETKEEAEDIFTEKWENVELEAEEEQIFLETDEGFETLKEIFSSEDEAN